MSGAVVTLTTDFGTRDPYVAQMKGVLATRAPGVALLDLSHDLPPFAVREAALFVRGLPAWFPPGSVHVVVVDPGVGGPRQALAVALGGQAFLGPDNGVFHFLLGVAGVAVRRLPDPPPAAAGDGAPRIPAPTFHGRDLFAPWAAVLVHDPAAFAALPAPAGPPRLLDLPAPRDIAPTAIAGAIIHVDRFGNCISNIPVEVLRRRGAHGWHAAGAGWEARDLVASYVEAAPGRPVLVPGSHGFLEIALREADAARTLTLQAGDELRLSWEENHA